MSNFTFLNSHFSTLYREARKAERSIDGDPRTSCFYARHTVELWVNWLYEHEPRLLRPYQGNQLHMLLTYADFERLVPAPIRDKAHLIRQMGNQALHSQSPISKKEARTVVRELFQVLRWLACYYSPESECIPTSFEVKRVPAARATPKKLKALQQELEAQDQTLRQAKQAKSDHEAQMAALREEMAHIQAENATLPELDYSEVETREVLIDLLLREAGWDPNGDNVREYPIRGLPHTKSGTGYVDYVLWGDDGLPLAVVEAKRTAIEAKKGRQQAKLYADALEKMTGQRPIIFYSNGYRSMMWDDTHYPPREVQGFYDKDTLQLLVQRRTQARDLAQLPINDKISGRPYQIEAIQHVCQAFMARKRKALLVMATGTGKTRTTIGLVERLIKAHWAKRILFLADRKALVKQATRAFNTHLPDNTAVSLLELSNAEKRAARDARIVLSTYHTIINCIDMWQDSGEREFGVAHFDLVIIDEAHRSVFRKFRAIFDYFDSHLLGLTATPRDEVDRNTYELFELSSGEPTYSYGLEEAVADGHLVPPSVHSIPTKFMREGIRYDDLSPEEQQQWDELEWGDGEPPDKVDAAAINSFLFNADTVDQMLQQLMTYGLHVAGGDRLGKTIIFARNQAHAEFIEARFNTHYPHLAGQFARIISYKEPLAQHLIDEFSKIEQLPHIAISVDMLDTGIDIPAVVNLVFFKMIRSKTKFYQMLGRGTRLAPELFGPQQDKITFYIFDYCQNFEFFNANPQGITASPPESLSQRLFNLRLRLLANIESQTPALSAALKETLQQRVAHMPHDNFLVRPKLDYVSTYAQRDSWNKLTERDYDNLSTHLSALPTTLEEEKEESKRFDLLMLQLQLAHLHDKAKFEPLRKQVIKIAANLEQRASIPMIHKQLELIEAVQESHWWRGVTLDMLETLRIRFRSIVQFIDKQSRPILYTNFSDQFGHIRETGITYDIVNRHQQDEQLTNRAASATHALAPLLNQPTLTPKQRAYLRAILNHLTQNNTLNLGHLYDPPFTNYHHEGPDGLFRDGEVDQLFEIVDKLNEQRGNRG